MAKGGVGCKEATRTAAQHWGNLIVVQVGASSLARGEVADLRQSHCHHLGECPGQQCGGVRGRQILRIVVLPLLRAYDVRERKQKRECLR